jgi:hypothetical protein
LQSSIWILFVSLDFDFSSYPSCLSQFSDKLFIINLQVSFFGRIS